MMRATTQSNFLILVCSLCLILLAGCNGAEDVQPTPAPGADGTIFDVQDLGSRGLTYHGESILLEDELGFRESILELSGVSFALDSGPLSLVRYTNPPLEYRGEVPMLAIRFAGLIESAVPGEIELSVTGFDVDILDGNAQAIEPDAARELHAALEQNGLEFPQVDPNEPTLIRIQINISDQHYQAIEMISDADFFHSFIGERPEIDAEPVAPVRP